jgi:hypothetical protein
MSFMDLSVKGKASPRHERPFSGKRSGYANKNPDTKANIFGISESSDQEEFEKKNVVRTYSDGSVKSNGSAKSNGKYRTPDAPRDSGAITIPSVSR